MPRRKLTEAEKERMQKARREARRQKDEAIELLERNPQFQHPKFWMSVDYKIVEEVREAMEKARTSQAKTRIKELEKELAELKSDV